MDRYTIDINVEDFPPRFLEKLKGTIMVEKPESPEPEENQILYCIVLFPIFALKRGDPQICIQAKQERRTSDIGSRVVEDGRSQGKNSLRSSRS